MIIIGKICEQLQNFLKPFTNYFIQLVRDYFRTLAIAVTISYGVTVEMKHRQKFCMIGGGGRKLQLELSPGGVDGQFGLVEIANCQPEPFRVAGGYQQALQVLSIAPGCNITGPGGKGA